MRTRKFMTFMIIVLWKASIQLLPLSLPEAADASEQEWPAACSEDSIASSTDGSWQKFMYYKSKSSLPGPLVISLHQWSSDYRQVKGSLVRQAIDRDWNYLHPDFRGANNHPKACCSDYAICDIDDVIQWAKENMQVDKTQVYVIGASGGGYAALCHLMQSKLQVAAYHAYVPITDLESWYEESLSRQNKYAADILACTGSSGSLDKDQARKRSPLHMTAARGRLTSTQVHLYAGIHDGYTGSVPVTHSLKFYNKLLKDLGAADPRYIISPEDQIRLLSARSYPTAGTAWFGYRKIHYHKKYRNIEVLIFEGGHEIPEDMALDRIYIREK